jgi:exodeoxyribonuclease VIII
MSNTDYIHLNLPDAEYRSKPGLSQSALKDFAVSPMHYKTADSRREETDAMEFGTASHLAVFQPHLLDSATVIVPGNAPKRPSSIQLNAKKPSPETVEAIEWWKQFDEANGDRIVLSKADHSNLMRVADAVRSHPFVAERLNAGGLFGHGKSAEVSVFGKHRKQGTLLKGRMDFVAHDCILDLKTFAKPPTPNLFRKEVWNRRYDIQAVHYGYLAELNPLDCPIVLPFRMCFAVVEKQEPTTVAIYELDADDLLETKAEWERLIARHDNCVHTGDFTPFGNDSNNLPFRK